MDQTTNAVQNLVLYSDVNETQRTWICENASKAVVTDYNGTTRHFDIIKVDVPPNGFPDPITAGRGGMVEVERRRG